MRRFLTIEPIELEEVIGLSGWSLGPRGDSLIDEHGNEAFFVEEDDGRISFSFNEDCEYRDLLERVPCEALD